MPVHVEKDKEGCFAQWGSKGKKYYFRCGDKAARQRAVKKAEAQGRAAYARGYVGNDGSKPMLTFDRVVANVKPIVWHDTMEGREFVVVPTQMITEGVHNGSGGPLYYPAEELAKLPSAWNHMPVVVYHPIVNGSFVSARTPEQLTSRKIGVLLNTKWDTASKKLGAEAWLDPVRVNTVDSRVADAIAKGEMLEVSTGLYMTVENKEGEWNGEKYVGIAKDLQPDHLALLPDMKGACSIEDGAGFLRVNQSHEEIRRLLSGALQSQLENSWIEEVHDRFFIYEIGGKLYKQEYEIVNSNVTFLGPCKLVERKVTFTEIAALQNNSFEKGQRMEKQKIVDGLISNEKTSWTEDHREMLMGLSDEILANMEKDAEELLKVSTTNNVATEDVVSVTTNTTPTTKIETVEEYIAKAPPEIRESLRMSVNAMNAEKARLISVIVANKENTFTEEHLKTMDLQMLQAIAKLAAPVVNEVSSGKPIPLYLGQHDTVANVGKLPDPLPLPSLVFGDAK